MPADRTSNSGSTHSRDSEDSCQFKCPQRWIDPYGICFPCPKKFVTIEECNRHRRRAHDWDPEDVESANKPTKTHKLSRWSKKLEAVNQSFKSSGPSSWFPSSSPISHTPPNGVETAPAVVSDGESHPLLFSSNDPDFPAHEPNVQPGVLDEATATAIERNWQVMSSRLPEVNIPLPNVYLAQPPTALFTGDPFTQGLYSVGVGMSAGYMPQAMAPHVYGGPGMPTPTRNHSGYYPNGSSDMGSRGGASNFRHYA
ncbi:hypothetical protein C8Q76DRAFT_851666 [Earliella scabrosa]|nr:hypothetical protein C8Q76DRAFT_851666 [Earliella scabrosa]